MTRMPQARAKTAREALRPVVAELDALQALDDAALRRRFEAEFGLPSAGRSKQRLLRRLAWKLQADRDGGLSDAARARIAELTAPTPLQTKGAKLIGRDPRLPPVGTVLRREFEGVVHEIIVRRNGFEWRGGRYASLTAVAKAITGKKWNGFEFIKAALRQARGG